MKSKKGDRNESTSFLIGLLVMILILIPIIAAIIQSQRAGTAEEKTMEKLIEETSRLKDGENGSILAYIEKDSFFVPFSKDNDNKPPQCGDKACICICEPKPATLFELYYCSEEDTCMLYDERFNLRFFNEKHGFINPSEENVDLYFQRKGDNIGLCLETPCISDEIKEGIDVYEKFIESYGKCKKYGVTDCLCDEVSFSNLPEDHFIRLRSDGFVTEITLYSEARLKEFLHGQQIMPDDTVGRYDPVQNDAIETSKFEIGKDADDFEDYFHENTLQLFKNSWGYVSFVKSIDGFQKIKEDKQTCEDKAKNEEEEKEEKDKEASEETTLPEGWKES